MQKYLIWHHLLLKRQMKKRTFLPLLLLMIFLLWLLQNMAFPDSKNLTVLLYNGGGEYGERLTDSLMRTESVFDFRLAENQAALEEEVAAGKAECGFEIGPEFAQNVTNGSTKDLIRYVASSLTARGIVARETVYTAFLDLYSENILQGAEGKLFGSGSPDLADATLGRYREYLDGSRIFHTDFETVSGTPGGACSACC